MPRIKQDFISTLLERVDIVDVVGSRIRLKKAGNSYTACCPFHNEKTPSFSVNQRKQYYNCFGCHQAGSAIKFIMDYDKISFVEAVEEVAKIAGISVEYEENQSYENSKKNKVDYYELLEMVVNFYQQELKKHPEAQKYLANRGIAKETIDKYKIGFSPNSWNFIKNLVGKNEQNRINILLELGLLTQKDDGNTYDTFRNRIIIPIRDKRGRTIAFGGRVMDDSKPKYINSKESPVYKKGYELFNLDFVRTIPSNELEFIMITEGYMDVIALDQYGVHNAVASLGTATTPFQLDLLFKQSDKIVFCYDGDDAGRHAAWRALNLSLTSVRDDKQLNFCFLPKEHDPDSLVRKEGRDVFYNFVKNSQSFTDYVVSEMVKKHNVDTEGGKINCLNELREIVKNLINAPILVQSLIQAVSRVISWSVERVEKSLLKGGSLETKIEAQNQVIVQGLKLEMDVLRSIVARLIQNPHLVNEIPNINGLVKVLNDFSNDRANVILMLLEKILKKPSIRTGELVESYRGTIYEKIIFLLAQVDLHDEEMIENVKIIDLLSFLKKFILEGIQARIMAIKIKARQEQITSEELAESNILETKIRTFK
ncbi:MAG: DNA primase [Succinivibrionaceae bacterium]